MTLTYADAYAATVESIVESERVSIPTHVCVNVTIKEPFADMEKYLTQTLAVVFVQILWQFVHQTKYLIQTSVVVFVYDHKVLVKDYKL